MTRSVLESTAAPWRRYPIVPLSGLTTSYPDDADYIDRVSIEHSSHTAWATQDCFDALLAAQEDVAEAGGYLSVTEVGRLFSISAKARNAYLRGEKHAYVAPPGESMHNGGQAVDWWVYDLRFDAPESQWLSMLWDIVIPLGFTPIISSPSLKVSECWHFDFRGPWQDTYAWFKAHYRSKAYGRMARCAILDAGAWDLEYDKEHDQKWLEVAYIQAQLHRVGLHRVGDVDGAMGNKTRDALSYVPGGHIGNREAIAGRLNGLNTNFYKNVG